MANNRISFKVIASILFLWGSLAQAADFETSKIRVPLINGMTLSEVEALWGTPDEKIEYEIKRQSLWKYPASRNLPPVTVIFRNGNLVSMQGQQFAGGRIAGGRLAVENNSRLSDYRSAPSDKVKPLRSQPAASRAHSFMALSDQKILSEILNEVPSEAEGAEGKATNLNSPASQQQTID